MGYLLIIYLNLNKLYLFLLNSYLFKKMEFQKMPSGQQIPQKEISLNQKEVEEKLLNRFDFLKQDGGLRQIYSSYDFRLEENNMKEVWEKLLDFLYTEIFNSYGIKMSDLKKYTLIKNRIPVGLNNIIQQFRIEQKYITDEDLKNINFYKINFPELYPQSQGYISSFLGGLKSIINLTGGKLGCNEDNDNNESLKIRTDITDEDKYKIIPDTQIVFNYEKFKLNCNNIFAILNDILQEEDIEVISTNNFIKILKERYIDNKNEEQFSLPYGITYLDLVLFYLEKIKKINLFTIQSNNKNLEFIKLPKTPNEPISNKDEAMAKILTEIESLERKNEEYEKKIEQMTEKIRALIKKGNKQSAKTFLIKKKNYQKFLENSQNTLNILEKQIFDIKNAESNANFTDILKKTLEVGKEVRGNVDDFVDVTEDIKEQKEALEEIQNNIKDLNLMANEDDEDINKELEELEKGQDDNIKDKKEDDFPFANDEDIKENKIIIEEMKNEK